MVMVMAMVSEIVGRTAKKHKTLNSKHKKNHEITEIHRNCNEKKNTKITAQMKETKPTILRKNDV